MKIWLALKGYVRARTPTPAAVPTAPAIDLIGARIHLALKAAGAGTTEQIITEVRRRHVVFLHANPADVLYAFGMMSGAAHYNASCEIALNAALLGYPAPDMRQAMLMKH